WKEAGMTAPSEDVYMADLRVSLKARFPEPVPWWEQHAPLPEPQWSGLSKAQNDPGDNEEWTQAHETANERSHAAGADRGTHVQEHEKDLVAGALLVLCFVVIVLGGWLLLRLMTH